MLNASVSPTISVIMSVKDGIKWIEESIDSVLEQSYKDFEFLILDDGSTDNTAKILDKYKNLDNRIKLYKNKNSEGLPSCLNKLISYARGTFIARMDADDICHLNRFECQLNFMIENPSIDVCFSNTNLILEDGSYLCKKWFPSNINVAIYILPYINYFVHPTCFIKKASFEQHGFYNINFLKAQDWELWKRFIVKKVKFALVPKTLLSYRLVENSNSASLSKSSSSEYSVYKANILIRNHHKLKSLKYIRRSSFKGFIKLLLPLLLPQFIFTLIVILNVKFNKNSVQQILMKQDGKN
jgi:glycosyltransferase involved in cell wall biosynthesis